MRPSIVYAFYDELLDDWYFGTSAGNPYVDYYRRHFRRTAYAPKNIIDTPYFDVMPEPYFGKMEDCLLAVLDINPGYTAGDENILSKAFYLNNVVLKGGYAEYAKPFPAFDAFPFHTAGARWWREKLAGYLKFPCMVPGLKPALESKAFKEGESLPKDIDLTKSLTCLKKRPFTIEMCPYHSENSSAFNTTTMMAYPAFTSYVKKRVISPFLYAIDHSVLQYGLILGQENVNRLIDLGYKPVIVWTENSILPNWPTNGSGVPVKKTFTYFRFEVDADNNFIGTNTEVNPPLPSPPVAKYIKVLGIEANNMKLPSPAFFNSATLPSVIDYIVEFMRTH